MVEYTLRELLGRKLTGDRYNITIHVPLAVAVGTEEAILISRLHYWLKVSGKKREGKLWIYNSIDDWKAEIPLWSTRTIRRKLRELKDRGLIETAIYNKIKTDRTRWYTINYDATAKISDDRVETLKAFSLLNKSTPTKRPKRPAPSGQNGRVLPEGTDVPSLPEDNGPGSSPLQGDSRPASRPDASPLSRTSKTTAPAKAASRKGHHPPGSGDSPPPEIRERHLANAAAKIRKRPTQAAIINFWKYLVADRDITAAIHTGKERGMVKSLITWWLENDLDMGLDEYLAQVVEGWDELRKGITWENGKPRLPENPSFAEVFFTKELILQHLGRVAGVHQQQQKKEDAKQTYIRIEDIPADHPNHDALAVLVDIHGSAKG